MNLLSVNIDNVKEQLDKDKETIKFYQENNTALSIRNKTLSKKVEEQSNKIEEF
jgi:regulator of replication initiation timing